METVPIRMDRRWLNDFQKHMESDRGWTSWERFELALEAAKTQMIPDFDTLQSLEHLQDFHPLPHQVETARRVLTEMRGRAILADEVGLGKTIEAGLILKEYLIRGLVKNALILVPSFPCPAMDTGIESKISNPGRCPEERMDVGQIQYPCRFH